MPQSWKILRIFFKIWDFNVSCDSVWQLVRGWKVQSRRDSEIFAAYLTTPSRVELPVAKNTYIKIFKIFVLIVLTTGLGDFLATWLSCKNRVFCANRSIFKLFLFSLELLWLFIVILILSLSQTHRALNPNLHCWSSLQPHSPKTRYGFLFSHSILHVYECISSFCEILLSLCVLLWFKHGFA